MDDAATEPLETIIKRVGALVAIEAIAMMGGTYGRRVIVLAGPGNNGADGKAAATFLEQRGVRVSSLPPDVRSVPTCDLVIDAAFGTGVSREYLAPHIPAGIPVLSIDVPSGFDGLTGEALGTPIQASRTIVLGALKPGLLFEPARSACGERIVVDIGLDATDTITPSAYEIEAEDIVGWLPARHPETHKWKSACWVVGGSAGMTGAAILAARGAQRGGAGYVRLSIPETSPSAEVSQMIADLVVVAMDEKLRAPDIDRFASMVVGPGLGRAATMTAHVLDLIAESTVPMVVDADALWHLGDDSAGLLARRTGATVLTPHDGEFRGLTGELPGPNRVDAAVALARQTQSVVLLKGATTVVAAPSGPAHVVANGDVRLATAGSGDVLAGLIGALLARGMPAQLAASAGAFVHAHAASLGYADGLVASDLPDLVARALTEHR